MKFQELAIVLAPLFFTGFLQAQDDYSAPRTEWDKPDLRGVWNFSSVIPLQRPAFFGDKKYVKQKS